MRPPASSAGCKRGRSPVHPATPPRERPMFVIVADARRKSSLIDARFSVNFPTFPRFPHHQFACRLFRESATGGSATHKQTAGGKTDARGAGTRGRKSRAAKNISDLASRCRFARCAASLAGPTSVRWGSETACRGAPAHFRVRGAFSFVSFFTASSAPAAYYGGMERT